jgi:hypothetical protein
MSQSLCTIASHAECCLVTRAVEGKWCDSITAAIAKTAEQDDLERRMLQRAI